MTFAFVFQKRHREPAAGGRGDLKSTMRLRLLRRYTALLAMTSVFCLPVHLHAANKNLGTSGAQFLKIGAGARPTAMGDAFVGIADDVNAIYFNPAGLATLERPELTAMHTQWFQGFNYGFGAFVLPTEFGSFGLSAATLQADGFEKRNLDESYGGTFESLDAAYTLSYAGRLGPQFSWGTSARYIRQELDTAQASAWAADLGVLKKFNRAPLSVGLAVRNVGQEVEFREESDPLPMTFDLGFGWRGWGEKLLLGLDVRQPRDNDAQFGMGAELRQTTIKDFRTALRAGYNSAVTDADGAGFTVGAGMGYRQMDLDFAWVPFGDLGNTFRYAVRFRF